ncbi:MAG TPA: hypothetical protein VM659_25275 [Dongiaceae bacterium]|nr:hypothetical protein [Dongiaceae bacterium]
MFDKTKPTKQELTKLAKGLEAAARLADQVATLDRAIESEIKALAFVDDAARKELSRTQLSLGVGNAYLKRLAAEGTAYLAAQAGKPAPKAKTKGTAKKAAAKKPAKKPAVKKKAAKK